MNINLNVNEIEPSIVLKIEFFSVRPDAIVNEEVRDLWSMFFSAKLETKDNESAIFLNMEFFVASLDAIVIEAVRDWL